jgi:hypothetical protein
LNKTRAREKAKFGLSGERTTVPVPLEIKKACNKKSTVVAVDFLL